MSESNRRQDFLATALDLFYERGYDKTTVNDIITQVKGSKGSFYHYFKSKEDVLEAVAEWHLEAELSTTAQIAADPKLSAVDKLNRAISGVMVINISNMEQHRKISSVFRHEGNTKLRHKVMENKLKSMLPLYLAIVEQGLHEGVFRTDFPEDAAEQIVGLLSTLNSFASRLADDAVQHPENMSVIKRKIKSYTTAMELIIGAPKGSIDTTIIIDALDKRWEV